MLLFLPMAWMAIGVHSATLRSAPLRLESSSQAQDVLEKPKKLSPIDTMRAELCFVRAPLFAHDPCIDWMVKVCTGKYQGSGPCLKLRRYVKHHCIEGQEESCDHARRLG